MENIILNIIDDNISENEIKTFNSSININEKNFNILMTYNIKDITLNIKEDNSNSHIIYEISYNIQQFQRLNKFFKMFDNNLEIYNKLIDFFINNCFKGELQNYFLLLYFKNIMAEFSIIIPNKSLIDKNKNIKILYNIATKIKQKNKEIKKEIQNINYNYSEKLIEMEKEIEKIKRKLNIKTKSDLKIRKKRIKEEIIERKITYPNESQIITKEEEQLISNWINPVLQIKYQILYRASEDGDIMKTFHNYIDNKGPTLLLIKSTKGKKFGGFNPISWKVDNEYYSHDNTFLFSLDKKKKYLIKKELKNYCTFGWKNGISFGYSGDLCIRNLFMKKNVSYCNMPKSFNSTLKYELTDERNFIVNELEVYSVQM